MDPGNALQRDRVGDDSPQRIGYLQIHTQAPTPCETFNTSSQVCLQTLDEQNVDKYSVVLPVLC